MIEIIIKYNNGIIFLPALTSYLSVDSQFSGMNITRLPLRHSTKISDQHTKSINIQYNHDKIPHREEEQRMKLSTSHN